MDTLVTSVPPVEQPSLISQLRAITPEEWFIALGLLLFGWLLRMTVIFVIKRLMKLAEKTDNDFDDVILNAIRRPIGWTCFLIGMWMAASSLPLPKEPFDLDRFFSAFLKSATIITGFWMIVRIVSGFIRSAEEKTRATNPQLAGVLPLGRKTLVIVMWIIAALIALQNLGYSVTSLLAGIGIGGAALAFAAKDTLANFFGSIVIFVDKPFTVGDWVKVGDIQGTVEEVSLRVTRVRTIERSLITVPNQDLTTKSIENWSRVDKRRVNFDLPVSLITPMDKLDGLVASIRQMIMSDEMIYDEPRQVYFTKAETSDLNIYVHCYAKTADFEAALKVKHELLVKIVREMESKGIDLAVPLRTITVSGQQNEESKRVPPVA